MHHLRTILYAAISSGAVAAVSGVPAARATPLPSWSVQGSGPQSQLGYAVASAGDVNGDGYGDVVVGAPGHVGPLGSWGFGEGAAVVFHGSAGGLGAAPAWSAIGSGHDHDFGWSVCGAGDVNGDGYDDVVVGAFKYTNGERHEGAAHLYLGSATGLGLAPAWSFEGNQVDGHFGIAVAATDVNGDGYADVLVGGKEMSGAVPAEGLAYLFLGGPAGLSVAPSWVVGSGQTSTGFGMALAGADVNGDGFGDVAVGAYYYTHDQFEEGVVAIYFGGPAGPGSSPSAVLQGNQRYQHFGSDVASAGDVDRDGYDDLLVGTVNWYNGEYDEGRVSLFLGGAAGPAGTPSWSAESNMPYTYLGRKGISGAGDVNGDGYDDVVLGAHVDPRACALGVYWCGSATLLLGGPSGLLTYAATAFGIEYNEGFGSDAASAGDVNGDGLADVIVGAPHRHGVGDSSGAVVVYHGR